MKNRSIILPIYIIWLLLLVALPFLIMIVLAFSDNSALDGQHLAFTTRNLEQLTDPIYVESYLNSIILSTIASSICLLIGYPVAYFLTQLSKKEQNILFAIFILPLWSNMLLRIMGWEILFNPISLLNSMGISLNLIGNPLAIIIGMVSTYLPLMIFPIFTVLNKLDYSLVEASKDLGASSMQTFFKVIFPLSLPGIYSGFTMTFLPSATNFALPERLSGGNINLLGNLISNAFGKSFDYNLGSLLSVILVTIIFIVMLFINSKDKDGDLLI